MQSKILQSSQYRTLSIRLGALVMLLAFASLPAGAKDMSPEVGEIEKVGAKEKPEKPQREKVPKTKQDREKAKAMEKLREHTKMKKSSPMQDKEPPVFMVEEPGPIIVDPSNTLK